MSIYYVTIIGIALAMDAFGVALGIGLNSILNIRHKMKFVLSFSFFQFLFTFIGGIAGHLFDVYITSIPSLVGGIVMGIVGVLMVADGFQEKENNMLIKNSTCIILGISVSIDALVIGFTAFHVVSDGLILFLDSVLIGIITLILSTFSFYIGAYMKKVTFITKYADFLGGVALILFGLKMIFF